MAASLHRQLEGAIKLDVFIEQIVKKKWSNKDYLKVAGIIVGGIILFVVLNYVMLLFGFQIWMMMFSIIIAGLIFLAWYLISSMRIEFEYSVTNGYVVIDKIASRRRRKRMITFESRDVEAMQIYKEEAYAQRNFNKVLRLDDADPEHECWCMELTHKDLGQTLIVFSPNERTLAAIKPFLRRQVAFHAFNRI